MDNTPFIAHYKHEVDKEPEKAHKELENYYNFRYCPWCGKPLFNPSERNEKE